VGCVLLLGGAAALDKVLFRDGGADRSVTFMSEGAPSIWQPELLPNAIVAAFAHFAFDALRYATFSVDYTIYADPCHREWSGRGNRSIESWCSMAIGTADYVGRVRRRS
jgi:hypothetical protein